MLNGVDMYYLFFRRSFLLSLYLRYYYVRLRLEMENDERLVRQQRRDIDKSLTSIHTVSERKQEKREKKPFNTNKCTVMYRERERKKRTENYASSTIVDIFQIFSIPAYLCLLINL